MSRHSDQLLGPYDLPLNRMITYRLSRLYAQLNAQAAKILKENSGLTQAQWRVLVIIDSMGPLPPNQIARRLLIDKGQLSRAISAMAKKGMVILKSSESDNRSHVVSMTSKGRALFERARPGMTQRQTMLMQAVSSEDYEVLFRVFDRIEAALQEPEGSLA